MTATKKKVLLTISAITAAVVITGLVFAGLFYFGVLHFNRPSARKYPVRGVDVSAYQGEIDWPVLAAQHIDFAYIKATEGSTFVDSHFEYNLNHALNTDLAVGAYHFFSFESSGEAQAAHFIDTVPAASNMLPPVIDVEFYGKYGQNPPEREAVTHELAELLKALWEHYNKRPILYVTKASYDRYVAGGFENHKIWYRSVYSAPKVSDGKAWTFWQFSNRHKLAGYSGEETYIDLNVYSGTKDEFEQLISTMSP